MECVTQATAVDGTALVTAVLENPHDEPARFRLRNELDGPVWPPRRRGHPEAGWDADGYEGVLEPGERRALGYAVPAAPQEEPATIAWTEPAEATDSAPTAETAARSFRDPRPPRSVISPPGRRLDEGNTGERP
ncbi:hypothetical protein RH831_02580 [Halodesulfurarchaeum sp. HSR-GB]|uniref:DUF7857 domain-containing protein n=1 Tax=Halodesulfurarchaeum sp. HSR-GB TaxID=3074077 RepID=UPI00285D2ABE|nr:hypothetical protein [Halodesulfurarchaeum sp. HSR-GB]MDR5656064.1 hypothetical protein [Halodesulfurarchaeum sp. HSR-GB]